MSETFDSDSSVVVAEARTARPEMGMPAALRGTSALAARTQQGFSRSASAGPVSIEVDLEALDLAGYLTPTKMRGRLAEQYRIIKRPLLKQALAPDADNDASRIIAVTSALPGEGKTFTVFNLAMSMAMERDISVLVIDADLLGRTYTDLLYLSDRPGLSDVLLDPHREPADVMVTLNLGHLAVMPAGRIADHPSELISCDRMRDVIRQLATSYKDRIILLDTAPLLTTSQAAVISDLAGQVLVVVEEGATPRQTVLDALSIMSDTCSVGLVLNKSRRTSKGNDWPYYGSA